MILEKILLKLKPHVIFKFMKKYILYFSVIILFGSCANLQIKRGDGDFNNLRYIGAIYHYKKAINKGANDLTKLKLARAYQLVNDYDNALLTYDACIRSIYTTPQDIFNYSKLLMNKGNYKEAANWLNIYLNLKPTDWQAEVMLASCNAVNSFYRDTTLYTVKQLQFADETKAVNMFSSAKADRGIVFSADKEAFRGKKTNPWTGTSYLDLYYTEKTESGKFIKPQILRGDINGPFHEGPAVFTKDGNRVYFTRSNYGKKVLRKDENNYNNLKIFTAEYKDGSWVNLKELPFNSDNYSCGHPTLSADETKMYFVSDMPGGFGGTDIYEVKLSNGTFGTPQNIGNTINTFGNEMFPYMHTDGTLYFSSTSHLNLGGLDVFATSYNGSKWMAPVNLNYPINTSKDDFSFVLNDDNKTGFISSNRYGADMISEFSKNDPTFMLFGIARKKGTAIPVEGVQVEIYDEMQKKNVEMTSDKTGKFKMKLNPETNYSLSCSRIGCFTRKDKISTVGKKFSENFYADFEVEEIIINKPIVIPNIYYDLDKWFIRPDAAAELDKLAKLLMDNPTIEIELGSHTDSRASDNYNLILSHKRAKSAIEYLVTKGIKRERMTYKGYGETVLVNRCKNDVPCTEEEHQQNRRTEFKVTKK